MSGPPPRARIGNALRSRPAIILIYGACAAALIILAARQREALSHAGASELLHAAAILALTCLGVVLRGGINAVEAIGRLLQRPMSFRHIPQVHPNARPCR